MEIEEIQNVLELLKRAEFDSNISKEKERDKLKRIKVTELKLPSNYEEVPPLIAVDGSYCFLFSFLGTETWIALFRVSCTEYKMEIKEGKLHYIQNSPPLFYDHLNLVSFNSEILAAQPEIFTIAANSASRFQDRKATIFAGDILSYLEDKALEKISSRRRDCILLKDGALLTFKAMNKEKINEIIINNCTDNNILFAGISKSTSTHYFGKVYTDDYYLKRFYDKVYPGSVFIEIPDSSIDKQTKFDVWGKIHFAKLHENAIKWFRVDIGNDGGDKQKLFSSIAAYSQVQLMPGYPISLIESHKIAKSVRDFKTSYESELLQSLIGLGLKPEDIMDGAVDFEGHQYNSFHSLLDQLSK